MNAISVTWCVSIKQVGKWGQFKIHGTMADATIQSMRWTDRWLVTHHARSVMGAQYASEPPADSHDGWGHWSINDLYTKKPADEAAKKKERKVNIVSAMWVDSQVDLGFGSSESITMGLESFSSTDESEEHGGSHGTSVMLGFESGFLGMGLSTGVTMNSEFTHNKSRTESTGTTRMEQRTLTMVGGKEGGQQTIFWLQVVFNTGDVMKILGCLVDTDHLVDSRGFLDEFNPDKFPKRRSMRAIHGAVQSAMGNDA